MSDPYILTKSILLQNVASESPRAAQLLAEYGLHCLSCYFRKFETLEMGSKVHGMSDEETDTMIKEINKQLEKEWKEQMQKNPKPKIINHK